MFKTFRIAWHEYSKQVLRKQFLGAVFAPLLFIGLAIVIGFVAGRSALVGSRISAGTLGFVDAKNELAYGQYTGTEPITFTRYLTEADAKAALANQNIVGYFVLAPDFVTSGNVTLFYWERDIAQSVRLAFESFVRTALISGQDPAVKARLIDVTNLRLETADGTRTFNEDNAFGFVVPILVGVLFFVALMVGGQYLMQAVLDEKENRTMEVMVSSVSPMQLMGGKVLGLGALAFTQVLVWLLSAFAVLLVLRTQFAIFQEVQIEPVFIVVAFVLFVLQFVLFGSIMVAVGATAMDQKQASNYIGPFVLMLIAPEFFIPAIFLDPNGIIAVVLSLVPFTAPLALVFRYGITTIPLWQIGIAALLMLLAAVGAVWLAGRIFRFGMLRFGQGIKLAELLEELRG